MLSSQLILLRKCTECSLEAHTKKDLEYFCKYKGRPYGRRNLCKNCMNRLLRTRYKTSHDRSNKKWHPRTIWFLGKNILLKENPRTNVCSECGRSYPEELKRQTSMHHDLYDPKNPIAHTTELCGSCHIKLLLRDGHGRFLPQEIVTKVAI